MVRFNSDVIFIDTSGQVRAVHSDLTLRANEAGGGHVIVGSGISLRPEVDCGATDAIDLGQEDLRWKTLYSCSGNFLDRPTVNGSGVLLQGEEADGGGSLHVDARPAVGSIIPETSGAFQVGSDEFKWGEIVASSGTFGNSTVRISQGINITHDAAYDGHSLLIEAGDGQTFPILIQRTGGGAVGTATIKVDHPVVNSGDAINVKYSGLGAGLSIERGADSINDGNALHIVNDGGGDGIRIDYNNEFGLTRGADSAAIHIENVGSSGNAIRIVHKTSRSAISIINKRNTGVPLSSEGINNSIGLLISHEQDAGSCMLLRQFSPWPCIDLNQFNDANAIDILHIGSGGNAINITRANGQALDSHGHGIRIEQLIDDNAIDVVQSGIGIALNIDIPASFGGSGIVINQDGDGIALDINHSATGNALDIVQVGDGASIQIVHTANKPAQTIFTTANQFGLSINKSNTGSSSAFRIDTTGGEAIFAGTSAGNNSTVGILSSAETSFTNNILFLSSVRAANSAYKFLQCNADDVEQFSVRGDGLTNAVQGYICSPSDELGLRVTQGSSNNNNGIAVNSTNLSYTNIQNLWEVERTGSTLFNFLFTISDGATTSNPRHQLRGDGAIFSDIAATTPADYAEYFECVDPSGLPMGVAVQLSDDDGEKIIPASGLDDIIGFTSANPAIITDSAWNNWHDKYLRDEFGAYQHDSSGNQVLNPVWNSGLGYVPREDRPEWITIGLLGKIWVRASQSGVIAKQYVTLDTDTSGLLRALEGSETAQNTTCWRVLKVGDWNADGQYLPVRILFK